MDWTEQVNSETVDLGNLTSSASHCTEKFPDLQPDIAQKSRKGTDPSES